MRQSSVLLGVLAAFLAAGVPNASAQVLSQARAYGVADRIGQRAYQATSWSTAWGDECERQTPWRESCYIEVWSETPSAAGDCWRWFDVVSPVFGSRLRLENVEPWACDPYPASGRVP